MSVDRRLKVPEIAKAMCISYSSVVSILTDHLDMRKLSSERVSPLLTIDNKRNLKTVIKRCFSVFSRNLEEFLCRFITVDYTWIH